MSRMTLSRGRRWRVLKRDGFRCRYCGRTGSECPLEVDHIVPVSWGGTNATENLATACRDCNRGKSADEGRGIAFHDARREMLERTAVSCYESYMRLAGVLDREFQHGDGTRMMDAVAAWQEEGPFADQSVREVVWSRRRNG